MVLPGFDVFWNLIQMMIISAAITTNYKLLVVSGGFTLKPVGEAEKRKTWVHSWFTMLLQTTGLVALIVVAASGSPQNKVRFTRGYGKFPHNRESFLQVNNDKDKFLENSLLFAIQDFSQEAYLHLASKFKVLYRNPLNTSEENDTEFLLLFWQ